MPNKRDYEQSHPWITFRHDLSNAPSSIWLLLGEVQAKCQYISDAPVNPEAGALFRQIYLAKGAFATTAIEGNSLTEAQVRDIVENKLKLPPSQEYLGQQVTNVLEGYNLIVKRLLDGEANTITPEMIAEYNAIILKDLTLEPEVIPGKIRAYSVSVGRYVGAPAIDCAYLIQELCNWINTSLQAPKRRDVIISILKAVIAHLYVAWIHPFGDGNGRTARLLEFDILFRAGIPDIAAHLLSNHYNKTRDEYYRQLDYSSRSGGNIFSFVEYALQGFVDGLDEQIAMIQAHQVESQWRNYLHRRFDDKTSKFDTRRKHLILDLSRDPNTKIRVTDIPNLSPRMAVAFTGKSKKTLQREVDALREMGLVIEEEGFIMPNIQIMNAFLARKVQK